MDTPTRTAASQLGVTQRQVQRLAQSGRVVSRTIAGRKLVASRSVVAASRSAGRGRHWDDRTVAAAAELLEQGTTERVTGSQRSRLRARLRTITPAELAYHALSDRVTIWRKTGLEPARPTAVAEGFTSTGDQLEIKVTQNASALARRQRLLEDTNGNILLIEIDTDAPTVIEDIALYAYGDTRTSSAALARIKTRQLTLA